MPKHFLCWPLLLGVAVLISPLVDPRLVSRSATITDLFAAADSTSPRLLEAKLEVARTRAFFGEQRAVPNPTLFGSSEDLGNDQASVTERTIGFRQDLGFLWSMGAQRSSASAAVAAAEARYDQERIDIQINLLLKVIRLQQLIASLQLSDTLERRYAGILMANDAREREGDISGFDAQRVRIESIAVTNRRVALQTELRDLIIYLSRETGLDESTLRTLDVEAIDSPSFTSSDEALAYAESHAPELRFLEANDAATSKSVTAAKLKRLPNLSVGVGQKSTDRDESGLLIEAELEIPLFNWRGSALQQARAEQYNAIRRHDNAKSQLAEVVSSAFERWQEVRRVSYESLILDELVNHVNAAHSLYLSGETGYLELLDAFQSSEEILSAAYELVTARIEADLRLREVTGYPIVNEGK